MKKLTQREKILLVVLIVVIIGVCWYKFLYEPINDQIDKLHRNRDTEQTELSVLLPKIELKRQMQETVEEIKAQGNAERIPVYDNSKPLMVALNKVLSTAESYSINFGEASRDDYIFLHKILLTFTTGTYRQARQLIEKLTTETFVNQISNIKVVNSFRNRTIENEQGQTITRAESTATVTLTITFFEIKG